MPKKIKQFLSLAREILSEDTYKKVIMIIEKDIGWIHVLGKETV